MMDDLPRKRGGALRGGENDPEHCWDDEGRETLEHVRI